MVNKTGAFAPVFWCRCVRDTMAHMSRNQKSTKIVQKIDNNNADGQPSPIFSAVALAMGVAVVVLAILKKIDSNSALIMLGIAVFGLGLNQLAAIADETKK